MPPANFPADLLSWRVNEMVFMALTHRYFMVYIYKFMSTIFGNSVEIHSWTLIWTGRRMDRTLSGGKRETEHSMPTVLKVNLLLKASFICPRCNNITKSGYLMWHSIVWMWFVVIPISFSLSFFWQFAIIAFLVSSKMNDAHANSHHKNENAISPKVAKYEHWMW